MTVQDEVACAAKLRQLDSAANTLKIAYWMLVTLCCLVWLIAFIFTGWSTTQPDTPINELEANTPGELFSGENSPEVAGKRLNEEARL